MDKSHDYPDDLTKQEMLEDLRSINEDVYMESGDEPCHCGMEEEDYGMGKCTNENPRCSERRKYNAYQRMLVALKPKHLAVRHTRRMSNPWEDVFALEWQKLCERHRGNEGSQLDHLIDRQASCRDAIVAASVMQWLGTSCGRGFLHECNRIGSARQDIIDDLDLHTTGFTNREPRCEPTVANMIDTFAASFIDRENKQTFERMTTALEALILLTKNL